MSARVPLWPFALISIVMAIVVSLLVAWPSLQEWWSIRHVSVVEAEIPQPLRVNLGQTALVVPRDLVRFAGQRRDGQVERLELVLPWQAIDRSSTENAVPFVPRGQVYISLSPSEDTLDPAKRFAAIYQRFLDQSVLSAPQGLTGRRFLAESGYDGEELFYDPVSPTAYFTRCAAPIADQPSICLRELRLGDKLDITYRFPRDALIQWRRLDQTIMALLGAIGAPER